MSQTLQHRKLDIQSDLPNHLNLKREFNIILSRDGVDENGKDLMAWNYNNFEVPKQITVKSSQKLSALKGKLSKMSVEEIDKQIKLLRDEWQRDI